MYIYLESCLLPRTAVQEHWADALLESIDGAARAICREEEFEFEFL